MVSPPTPTTASDHRPMIANVLLAVVAVAGFSCPLWLDGPAMQASIAVAGVATGAILTLAWSRSWSQRVIQESTSTALQDRKIAVAIADRHVAAWRAIVDHVVEGIVTIDSNGSIETVNDAAESLFGYAREELIGKNVKILMPEPFHSEHDEYVARYLRTGERRIIGIGREVTGRRKDKSQFPIDLSVGEGTIDSRRFFTAVIRDISKRKELQSKLGQTERLAAVGELAAGVAHEINNPINTMINCAQLIEDGDEPIANGRIIIEEGGRIADIVRALLQFARDDRDHAQPTSLAEVVERTMSLIGESWKRHGITLTIDVDANLPAVFARPQKVQQVLLNLMINAKDALVLHDIENRYVSLAAHRSHKASSHKADSGEECSGEGVEFTVSDNGPGIAASVRERIFEPFITTKRARGGTGLGLSICRSIIEGYGGTIRVDADDGGSVFTIWLPIAPTEPNEPTASSDSDF
ncbi:MAG: two-component system sensor kinase FixL [Planctomycetota bacterium]|jgi:two-component system sensor kinase FixL